MFRTELFTVVVRVAVEKGRVDMVCSKLFCACRSRAGVSPGSLGCVTSQALGETEGLDQGG